MKVVTLTKRAVHCLLIAVLLGSIGCGTVASVRPIGKGKSSLAFSSGGPVAPIFDINMPVPYTVLRYRRGLNETADVHLGIHPTMMILGNIGIDFGLTQYIVPQYGWRPALSLTGSIYGFYHMNELSSIRVYPEITLVGSYQLSDRQHTFYFGTHTIAQLARPYIVFAPLIGFEIPFGKKLVFNIETKWYAPSEESEDRVVDYTIRPLKYGAVGFVWGLSYKF